MSNATLLIFEGGFAVRSRFLVGTWSDTECRWPVVVIQTLRPISGPSLLFEMNGKLASCRVMFEGRRLRAALKRAGFTIIEVSQLGWEAPRRVSKDILGVHASEVPSAIPA
jgi:hypothetical protein